MKEDWADIPGVFNYDLFIVMTKITKEDGSKGRELLLSSCDEERVLDAADFFKEYDDGLLGLEYMDISPVPDFSISFDQTNTKLGRKQVGPISQEFLDTITDSPDCLGGPALKGSNIFS